MKSGMSYNCTNSNVEVILSVVSISTEALGWDLLIKFTKVAYLKNF